MQVQALTLVQCDVPDSTNIADSLTLLFKQRLRPTLAGVPLLHMSCYRFITYQDDASVDRAFSAGPMHDLAGKKVEVKPATPRGSGPVGRGGGLLDRGPVGGYRGQPPGGGRSYPLPYAAGWPAIKHVLPSVPRAPGHIASLPSWSAAC